MTASLAATLAAAASGRFPPVDGGVDVIAADERFEAVIAFTGHAVVATALRDDAVLAQRPDGYGAATDPRFLVWLARGGWIGSLDAVLAVRGTGDGVPAGLAERPDLADHPRAARALSHRSDVRLFGDDDGLLAVGRGLAGRWEVSVEVAAPERGRGLGRRLISAARGVVPAAEWLWAQVAPGNAASLRAFLACGYVPVCAEVLIDPGDAAVGA